MSKSSTNGAQPHSSKTNFSCNDANDFFDNLTKCNNLTITNAKTKQVSPIVVKRYEEPKLEINNSKIQNFNSFISDSNFSVTPPKSVINNSALSSRLAFLLAEVSLVPGKCKKPITVLHDSGCAKTILSYEVFRQFPDSHKVGLQPAPHLRVESFEGAQSSIVGIINLYIQFTGSNGVVARFSHPVIVHKSTTHDLMLGRDFTGETLDYRICETASVFL